ncbi:hypothetical protein M9H77_30744 [Catharanthus roseus]|uniref:Uncharacterized protein n=1 Tax=Catharanthus roseus TaxID=4058 RepID=A0ACB9ZZF0_CATRO|nr:hypothetical protein M9H77_30744 [Catharanthus roseus]
MVANMEEALKNKLEESEHQEKTSKLFSICSISKDHSREQFEGSPGPTFVDRLLLGIPWKSMEYNLQSIEDSHQSGIRETSK